MKLTSVLAFVLTTTLSAAAFAGVPGSPIFDGPGLGLPPVPAEKPLVTKSSGAGFVMPDFARSEVCDVYADRVEITKSFGSLTVTETKFQLIDGDVQSVIDLAAEEETQETENFLCDGPSTFIVAGGDVVLYSTGGCGSPKQQKNGPATQILIDLASTHCPKTF